MPLPFRSLCAKLRTAIKGLSAADRAALDGTLPHLIAQGSSYSYRIAAGDFIRLCAQVGLDPITGKRVAPCSDPGSFCSASVGAGCALQRRLQGKISLRELGLTIGCSAATLSRLEKNLPVSIETVLAVCVFIGVHPFHYMQKQRRAA